MMDHEIPEERKYKAEKLREEWRKASEVFSQSVTNNDLLKHAQENIIPNQLCDDCGKKLDWKSKIVYQCMNCPSHFMCESCERCHNKEHIVLEIPLEADLNEINKNSLVSTIFQI